MIRHKIIDLYREYKILIILLISVIIFYAFFVRFLGIKFGLPYLHHWDEPQSASTALQMLKAGDLNPHLFAYPDFPIYSCLMIDIIHYYYLRGKKISDSNYLGNLNEIVTNKDTNWQWTISHPSFYLWNRAFISLLGTISVLFIYLITKEIYGKNAGLLAALLLSGFSFHIEQSRYITPDMPSSFFVLLVVLFSLRFNHFHKFKDLLLSVIFVGFAISCKYNMVLSILVPLAAYFLNIKYLRSNTRLLKLGLILILPVIIFLILNPFVLIDFKLFLTQTGDQVAIYKLGAGGPTSPPPISPWIHFILQMSRIENYLSSFLFYLALFGIFVLFKKPKLLFLLLIFPAFHTYVLTQQVLDYHRNFLVIYPFFAIFSAVTVIFISTKFSQLGSLLQKKYFSNIYYLKNIFFVIPILILMLIISSNYIHSLESSYSRWRAPETRTHAIDYINKLTAERKEMNIMVGIASELRIHRLDIKNIKTEYQIFNHENITTALKECDYLLVGKYESYDIQLHNEDNRLNKLTPESLIYFTIGNGKTRRDIYSVNPQVIILRNPKKSIIKIRPSNLEGKKIDLGDGSIFLPWGGKLNTKKIRFEKSKYKISIFSKGNDILGETAKFKVYIGNKLIGEYFTSTEYKEEIIQFTNQSEEVEQLIIEYANDYTNEESKLDRNAWIGLIIITELKSPG